ncbi:hypothetical protein HYU72_01590 [Candidatus Berkelbacteria bacterium]|nr:hypothetical protein [Candidatus Berkelbacteria bacterium]
MSKRRWLATLVGVLVLLVAASAYTFHQKSQGEIIGELRQMVRKGEIVEQKNWKIRYISEEESGLVAIEKGFGERGVLIENPDLASGWFTAFLVVARSFEEETIVVYPGWHLKKMGGLFLPPEPEEGKNPLKLLGFRELAVVLIEGRAPGLPTEATGLLRAPLVQKEEFLRILRETLPEMRKNGRKAEVLFIG